MRLLFIIYYLCISLISPFVSADDLGNLQQRLNKIKCFYSTFEQQVIDSNGIQIQNGKGELWIDRPNKFKWHMITPSENIIISDGKILWVYNPLINQVSINFLQNIIRNTPFILILQNLNGDWQKYNVRKHGNDFKITQKSKKDIHFKYFIITVMPSGVITKLNIIEQDGQRTIYKLKNYKYNLINSSTFILDLSKLPQGLSIDDLR